MNDKRPYLVIIDPGHGGRDPGAVNKRLNIQEKDINLKVSQHIHKIVNQIPGDFLFKTQSTRYVDNSVSLQSRCDLANRTHAHAFVSIHCNAKFTPKPGVEIETYHYPGSAKGENLASWIQQGLVAAVDIKNLVIDRGIKTKKFYVLKHTIMPAALVELGFITDDEEAIFLNNPINQFLMANSIANSIEMFLEGGGI